MELSAFTFMKNWSFKLFLRSPEICIGKLLKFFFFNCCGATEGSEQQHNQDLKEIYKGRRILEFITFYHNALHLTTLFTTMHCI